MAAFLIFEELNARPICNYVLNQETRGFQYNRSFIIFAFLSLFSIYLLSITPISSKVKKYSLIILITMISAYTLHLGGSQTAQLGFICGFLFLTLFPVSKKIFGKTLFTAIIILCLTLPFFLKPLQNLVPEEMLLDGILKEASIIYRFEVWNFTITEIQKNPLYGQGIEAQRFIKSDVWMKWQNSDQILHAHNASLQIWLEFGLIGILLGCLFLYHCYKTIYAIDDLNHRRLYLTFFTTAFCCVMTGYGIWQSWQIGVFFAFAALAILINNNIPSKTHKSQP